MNSTMRVQDLLRMAHDETVRNALALDMISPPTDRSASSAPRRPISKHVLDTLFNSLSVTGSPPSAASLRKDDPAAPGPSHVYVENEQSDHFLYGLVLPLLARILAVSCPGLMCVVALGRGEDGDGEDDSARALRQICNGFEVLTGRMPVPRSSPGDFTLSSTGWMQAGVISPRKSEGVVMTFSNGMMVRAQGVVVSFSNGSMVQLTLDHLDDLVQNLRLPDHVPVVVFTLSGTSPRPLNGHHATQSPLTALKNALVVEIGHKGTKLGPREDNANGAIPATIPKFDQARNGMSNSDVAMKNGSSKRMRSPASPKRNGTVESSRRPEPPHPGYDGASQNGVAGPIGESSVSVVPNTMPLFVNSASLDTDPTTRLPNAMTRQRTYGGGPPGPPMRSPLPGGGVPTYGVAHMPDNRVASAPVYPVSHHMPAMYSGPNGHVPPGYGYPPYNYVPMGHGHSVAHLHGLHQAGYVPHDRSTPEPSRAKSAEGSVHNPPGEPAENALEALVHMRQGYHGEHAVPTGHAVNGRLNGERHAGAAQTNGYHAHPQPTNGYHHRAFPAYSPPMGYAGNGYIDPSMVMPREGQMYAQNGIAGHEAGQEQDKGSGSSVNEAHKDPKRPRVEPSR